jgi:DNA polymerase III delta prime subunit
MRKKKEQPSNSSLITSFFKSNPNSEKEKKINKETNEITFSNNNNSFSNHDDLPIVSTFNDNKFNKERKVAPIFNNLKNKELNTLSNNKNDIFIDDFSDLKSISCDGESENNFNKNSINYKNKKKTSSGKSTLWVDKYSPKELSDLVGNLDNTNIIYQWLLNWIPNRVEEIEKNMNENSNKKSNVMKLLNGKVDGKKKRGRKTKEEKAKMLLNPTPKEIKIPGKRGRKKLTDEERKKREEERKKQKEMMKIKDKDIEKNIKKKKAILISGLPGTGKTTAAYMIGNLLNYNIIEINASDERKKKDFEKLYDNGVTCLSLDLINDYKNKIENNFMDSESDIEEGNNEDNKTKFLKNMNKGNLIIIEEVDGIGEHGGINGLIQLIEKTQCPIICTCNERYGSNQLNMSALAYKCIDIIWEKPITEDIVKRIQFICNQENLDMSSESIKTVIDNTNGDIRQTIIQIQEFNRQFQKNDDSKNICLDLETNYKDINNGFYDTLNKLSFHAADLQEDERINQIKLLSNEGYNFVTFSEKSFNNPKFIRDQESILMNSEKTKNYLFENYLKILPKTKYNESESNNYDKNIKAISRYSAAVNCFSLGDCFSTKGFKNRNWKLLSIGETISIIGPSRNIMGHPPNSLYSKNDVKNPLSKYKYAFQKKKFSIDKEGNHAIVNIQYPKIFFTWDYPKILSQIKHRNKNLNLLSQLAKKIQIINNKNSNFNCSYSVHSLIMDFIPFFEYKILRLLELTKMDDVNNIINEEKENIKREFLLYRFNKNDFSLLFDLSFYFNKFKTIINPNEKDKEKIISDILKTIFSKETLNILSTEERSVIKTYSTQDESDLRINSEIKKLMKYKNDQKNNSNSSDTESDNDSNTNDSDNELENKKKKKRIEKDYNSEDDIDKIKQFI